jgi:PhnB protein
MPLINPYLTFLGNCEEAFNYYKTVFGGEFSYVGRFSEMPAEGSGKMSDEDGKKIMHISLPISKETTLMGSDTGGEWGQNIVVGNNITISINADNKEQADTFYKSLSEGGNANMPMDQTFWGDYFGMCTDKFGINWMISFNENYKAG